MGQIVFASTKAPTHSVLYINGECNVKTTILLGTICLSLVYLPCAVVAADGWASTHGDTTGGAGGTVVTVDTLKDLKHYAELGTAPITVNISGTIDIGDDQVEISSNKTLIGADPNATLIGILGFKNRSSNIIVERLNITNPNEDGMAIKQDVTHVVITKCTFYDCGDGCLDISNESDLVTISWCKFTYTNPKQKHRFVCLFGSSDKQTDDRGKLRITVHHNWWADNCHERMPRVRYGQVHCYNNYYDCPGNNYCIGVGVESNIRVENNVFNNVNKPWANYFEGKDYPSGKIGWNSGNVFYNTSMPTWASNEYTTVFTPPYPYAMNKAACIPALVKAHAGARNPYPPKTHEQQPF